MPIGDVLLKLGKGETLSAGELDQLRVRMNFIEATASGAGEVMSSQGAGLSPTVFRNSGAFSMLPHETASIRFDTQNIANNSLDSPVPLASGAATWAYGFSIDTSTGLISIRGIPNDSVYLFAIWWQWAANTTGYRRIQWYESGAGNAVNDYQDAWSATEPIYSHIVHVRRQAGTDASYGIKVFQDSGGDLAGDGVFTATRLR